MSERTAPAIEKLDVLLPLIKSSTKPDAARLLEEAEALRRAVIAFHMEAIRFRIYNVDRLVKQAGDEPATRQALEDVRHALETAGFHTRSHATP